jgi:DNA (cytosine-5)-methyltransferase 1
VLASRRHPYLAQVSCEGVSKLLPQAGDSAVMLELKAFCVEHGITDVFMRMLHVSELKLLMGFPADYQLLGTVTEQKKMLGNAVVPAVAAALARSMGPVLAQWRGKRLPKLRRGVVYRWEQGDLFRQAA